MKFTKSLLLLIVAIIAGSNATETFSNFNVTNSAAGSKCLTAPVELKIGSCQSACESVIMISLIDYPSNFTFNQFGTTDSKCASAFTFSYNFTCTDGTSKVPIEETTYSVVCVPDKSNSSQSNSSYSEFDSSDSSRLGSSFALFALGLLSLLSL
ncbi:hypothetical protein RB653_000164 [Dictyostelium firmibasis]|uniref:Uncharacterized protein n=1 Tax=Dictyostelium firmibasis TaxID=79012 RepID=A0AAN7U2S5_9MYCE